MKRKAIILLLWIGIWQLLSIFIHNSIVLVGPADTMIAFVQLIKTQKFLLSIGNSFTKITMGFLMGSVLGIFLAGFSYKHSYFEEFIRPLMLLLKTVPVVSFVILALIWIGNKNLSSLISMMVVMPILYFNTLVGLQHTDHELLEMAQVYHMSFQAKLKYIFFPEIYSYLLSGFQTAIGMSWKSGVAAEVIGQPLNTIGNGLYRAKIYLENGEILAWTITLVMISFGFEKIFIFLLGRLVPNKIKHKRRSFFHY